MFYSRRYGYILNGLIIWILFLCVEEYYRLNCKEKQKRNLYGKFKDRKLLRFQKNGQQVLYSLIHPSFLNEKNSRIAKRCLKSTEIDLKLPWIVGITPTHASYNQVPDLVRLGQTLEHVENFLWVVVEDATNKTENVKRVLNSLCINYVHLNIKTALKYKKSNHKYFKPHRGVEQRNMGLEWLRKMSVNNVSIIVYFMDDDNTYSVNLFDHIRYFDKVAFFPVGLAGGSRWSGPVCNGAFLFSHFFTNWGHNRKFPVDMAGFAVNNKLLLRNSSVIFRQQTRYGYLETNFLEELITPKDIYVPKELCFHVSVWHTRTERPRTVIEGEKILKMKNMTNYPNVKEL